MKTGAIAQCRGRAEQAWIYEGLGSFLRATHKGNHCSQCSTVTLLFCETLSHYVALASLVLTI